MGSGIVHCATSLRKTDYQKKLYTWIKYELPLRNFMDQVFICESLLKGNEIKPFLKRMVTGDEKWITYNKICEFKKLS